MPRLATLLTALALVAAGCGDSGPEVEEIGFDTGGEGTATFAPREDEGVAGPPRVGNPQPQRGSPRSVFEHTCGSCHRLAAAGTEGRIGPDLDALRPSAERVEQAIRNGAGTIMPSNLLLPRDARRVARFVEQAARGG